MTNTNLTLTINHKARKIEMSKAFDKAASVYGSPEYNNLQGARRDYPDYQVITLKPAKRNDPFKGVTMEYMEKYIASHDDDGKIMTTFNILRGKVNENDELGEYAESASFFEIREWFLKTFPEIKAYSENSRKRIDMILGKAA